MTTTRTDDIQVMLNDYMPNKLLSDELIKRDFFLTTVARDFNCKGISNSVNSTHNSKIVVPFKSHGATNVRVNGLTDEDNVGKAGRVRGYIDKLVEFWGTLKLEHGDICDTEGKISESSFVDAVTDEVADFADFMKEQISMQMGTGPHLCKVTDSSLPTSGTDWTIDRIDKLQLNQEVEYIKDDTSDSVESLYVKSMDLNTSKVKFSLTRGGAAATGTTISMLASGTGAKTLYLPGILDDDADGSVNTILSARNVLLSAANGGSASVHGKTKTSYPFLQSINIDGAASGEWTAGVTSSNILDCIFDGYVKVQRLGRGSANTVVCSYLHLAWIMKLLEDIKGAYKVTKDPKATLYGWTEIEIMSLGNAQNLKIVGLQEWDDDVIAYLDFSHITMRSNGGFRKRKGPNGNEYFELRTTSGYSYLIDSFIAFEMEYRKPSTCGIIYDIASS